MKRYNSKVAIATTFVVLSGALVYSILDNKFIDEIDMDMVRVVEAKSNNYVEPYVDDEVEGVSNNQSEILEDGNLVDSYVDDVSSASVATSDEIVNNSTTTNPKPINSNIPVKIEYVNRSDYTGVVPNEMNDVVIAMYHGVSNNVKSSDAVHRSITGFKKDLKSLYDNGYRAITMDDLMTNNISVPEGFTPVVLTFDDGLSTQMSMVKDSNGNLVVKENTAVDIINDFNETYPDFGTHALFYVYTKTTPFKGTGSYKDCAEYLLANGYELGSHTYSHTYLTKCSVDKIKMELAYSAAGVAKGVDNFHTYDVKYLAYPYGSVPKDEERRQYLLSGTYDGFTYNYHSAVLAAPNLKNSTLIYSNKFDPLSIGRFRGTDNANMDLNWKIRNDEKNKSNKFVSDGDPNVVTILEKDFDKVNLESLNGKTLRVIKG